MGVDSPLVGQCGRAGQIDLANHVGAFAGHILDNNGVVAAGTQGDGRRRRALADIVVQPARGVQVAGLGQFVQHRLHRVEAAKGLVGGKGQLEGGA